ncbi:hypothetical protein K466DRAFT_215249 [Polyporus arcularius HHB13444]|uniref:Uncharacterized protein n=1 Tax=Polyporus arcularius HHB13444 TaxID=1314778 RepID=A0A5C3P8Z3_9APHY|nr:hypothetical protein K466DRAFT_215249 [Polyporus arcularius HHB13444]
MSSAMRSPSKLDSLFRSNQIISHSAGCKHVFTVQCSRPPSKRLPGATTISEALAYMKSVCESESAREPPGRSTSDAPSRPVAAELQSEPSTCEQVRPSPLCRPKSVVLTLQCLHSPRLCAPSCAVPRGPSPSFRLANAVTVGPVTQRCLPHPHSGITSDIRRLASSGPAEARESQSLWRTVVVGTAQTTAFSSQI